MEDYKPNSHKLKEEREASLPEKKVEKIVSGSVKSKKKNGIQKITDVFIPEDVDNVKTYVFEDVIVPAVKDIILDTVRAFLGIDKKSGRNSNASKVAYRSYYDKDNRRDSNATRIRTGYDFDDIILDNRGEAEDVLARMDELIDTYGLVLSLIHI